MSRTSPPKVTTTPPNDIRHMSVKISFELLFTSLNFPRINSFPFVSFVSAFRTFPGATAEYIRRIPPQILAAVWAYIIPFHELSSYYVKSLRLSFSKFPVSFKQASDKCGSGTSPDIALGYQLSPTPRWSTMLVLPLFHGLSCRGCGGKFFPSAVGVTSESLQLPFPQRHLLRHPTS